MAPDKNSALLATGPLAVSSTVNRYEPTHKIILCGDLNGALLLTRNNKHDSMLRDFTEEHMLSTCDHSSLEPIFFHFNGIVSSQIDYILSNDAELIQSYSTGSKCVLNVSFHVPVEAAFKCHLKLKTLDVP